MIKEGKKVGETILINIASTIDSAYTDVLTTFYTSILENNLGSDFHFFIIVDKLTKTDKTYIKQLKKIYENLKEITFLPSNFAYYKNASVNSPVSAIKENTYYKVELPLLVSCSRLLYLDADMICTGDISNLWKANLKGNIIGAVEDAGDFGEGGTTKNRLDEMQVAHTSNRYFNAGLVLFDINKWNENHITQKTRKFVAKYGDILTYSEQDALNALLNNKWQPLNLKYNVVTQIPRHDIHNPTSKQTKIIEKARKAPRIIHYTEWAKPWVRSGKWIHPWRYLYYYYKYIATLRLHNYAVNKKTAKKENPIK